MMLTNYELYIRNFLNGLVNPTTNEVRYSTLYEADAYLRQQGFKLSWKQPYGPKEGWMLFYWCAFAAGGEGVVVRIKTHGETAGKPRAFRPHLSAAWMEHGIDYGTGEKHQLNPRGIPESKSPPQGATNAEKQAWADRTHFMFPGFANSSAQNPAAWSAPKTSPKKPLPIPCNNPQRILTRCTSFDVAILNMTSKGAKGVVTKSATSKQ